VYTATLCCGEVLGYEARSFLPMRGESVPCARHGYCDVERVGTSATLRARRHGSARARAKGQDELLEWLRGRSETTIHALRKQRFTLRMIAAAERNGLVAFDPESGTVALC
jgi:hypothetical protein